MAAGQTVGEGDGVGVGVGGRGMGVKAGCWLQSPLVVPKRSSIGTVHSRPESGPNTYQ